MRANESKIRRISGSFLSIFLRCAWLACVVSAGASWSLGAEPAEPRDESYTEPLPDGAIARLGVIRFRASGQLNWMGLSADGRTLATINVAGTLRIWDTQTGRLVVQRLEYARQVPSKRKLQFDLSNDQKNIIIESEKSITIYKTNDL